MRAVVTGANGFIGRHLVSRLLQEGYLVRAIVRRAQLRGEFPSGVDMVVGDLHDSQTMKDVMAGSEVVFHLAGKAHALDEGPRDVAAYQAVNVDGTKHTLDGAIAAGVRRLVFFSSVKAMGEESSECQDESSEARPLTHYGRSKLAAERLVFEYGRQGQLAVTCLRLPMVYGLGNRGNLFRMISAIDRGMFPPLPATQNRRSMVHISNVVEAAVLAGNHPDARGRCYIVTDERAYSTRELYEAISRALGRPVPRWSVPLSVLAALAHVGDLLGRIRGQRVYFDSDALAKLTGSAWYSAARISRELGYRPLVSFDAALPGMIVWYRTAHP